MDSEEGGPGRTGFPAVLGLTALDSDPWLNILAVLALAGGILLAVAGAHASAALARVSRGRLLARLDAPERRARAESLLADMEEAAGLAGLLKLAGLAATLWGFLFFTGGSTLGLLLWGVLAGASGLFLLEILPLAVARRSPEPVVLSTLGLLLAARALCRPILRPLQAARRVLLRALGLPARVQGHDELADEILAAVEEQERPSPLAKDEREWIENIVDLKEMAVSAVMTPRTDMIGVEAQTTMPEVLAVAVREGHSRLPVYENRLDAIVGIFYVKDLLPVILSGERPLAELGVRELMRKPFFIPETKRIPDLLKDFRTLRLHMAIVLDEYGGTAGLVTIEDILEEIVGEIEDEYDSEEEVPVRVLEAGRSAEVDARAHVWEVNESLQIDIPEDEDYDTMGGFVCSVLGRIPAAGESFEYGKARIEILKADERSIEQIRVEVLSPQEAREAGRRDGGGWL